MPEHDVRPTALDAALARLGGARDQLAKRWLMRLLERASLEEIEQLATDRIARELPGLIAGVLDAVRLGAPQPGAEALERAARLAELRGGGRPAVAALAQDLAAFQAVLLEALREELATADPLAFAVAAERLARVFGAISGAAIERAVAGREQELERLANTDPLTGLYNVRWLTDHLGRLLDHHRRYGHPFALLVLDVDGLKRVNDSQGHAAGDRALVAVADAIRSATRRVDAAARIGGDEFCVVAPQQTADRARVIAERIAAGVEAAYPGLGASIGVAACPEHGLDAERLLELGDEAMYRAKAAGRRVALAESGGPAWAGADR